MMYDPDNEDNDPRRDLGYSSPPPKPQATPATPAVRRPNPCGGALMRPVRVADGWSTRRLCREQAPPGLALCPACQRAEDAYLAERRQKLGAELAPKKPSRRSSMDE